MSDRWKDAVAASVGNFSFVLAAADSVAGLDVEVRSPRLAELVLGIAEALVLGIAEPDELHLLDPMLLSAVVVKAELELCEETVVAMRIQIQY